MTRDAKETRETVAARPSTEGVYRLSFLQQGLLYHSLVDPEAAFYVDQVVYTLDGALDEERFERVWRRAVARHEMLRTSFFWEGIEELVQVVHRDIELPLERHDWQDRPQETRQADRDRFLTEDRLRGFDLERPPLFRLSLVRHAPDHHTFVFRYHHLLFDAWSALMVLDEAFTDYNEGATAERTATLPYRDYVAWLHRQDLSASEAYWRTALGGLTEATPLPGAPLAARPAARADRLAPAAGDGTDHATRENPEEVLWLDAATTEALTAFARDHRVTLNSVFQSAWSLLLSRHSGRDEVMFGTTVSHRPADLEGVQHTAGLFINTLPVRARTAPGDTFAACCARLQQAQGERRDHHHSPLMKVQEWSDLPSGAPLFDTIMTFLNVPRIETLGGREGALHITRGEYRYRTNYPLSVMVVPGERLSVRVGYDRDLYDAPAVRGLLGQLRTVLAAVAAEPGVLLRDIPLLSADEEARLLREWGGARPAAPADATDVRCAHDLVADQADRTPDATALVHRGTRVGYRELTGRARRLARHLRELGAGPDTPVAVCLERGTDLPTALLAVLHAGGAYTPLDPAYPAERLAHMLRDSGARIVLTQRQLAGRLPAEGLRTVLLDDDATAAAIAAHSDGPLPGPAVHPDSLAYVIYTSGSTGTPKGTALTHRGLANLVAAQRRTFALTPEDRVLQWASASFDASVFETVLALGAGAELHLADREDVLPGPGLARLLRESGITALTMPPSALSALPEEPLPGLRLLVSAGEALPQKLAAHWSRGRRMVNAYGPTETTVWATAQDVADPAAGQDTAPIGTPVHGFTVHVLDAALRPVPAGALGELFLAGPGVARGYLGQPARTAAAFLPDPYGPPGARMYRTGDLARWRADGTLQFAGRDDQQVKLRGFRIELGEIEAVLGAHPDVLDRAVVVRDGAADGRPHGGDARLVGYAVPRPGATLDGKELRAHLEARLPEHLVPAAVVPLERMPITVTGKLDRAALPSPEEASGGGTKVRPATEAEQFVAEIWTEVLGVEDPGVDDDFFETGGNSIKATQLRSRIKRAGQVEIPVRDVLKARTLRAVALLVEEALAAELDGLTDEEIQALADEEA
ncbi:amino acid adenylation domain-containing protein [Streptomyces sp. S186]|uniref:amino acid adenylation domain-containing protein n=1 Tax=Streptomyces sp. S186 TaxID=3434395 RepID=UPI003F678036